jgi:threonyl-tRNA synthetase
MTELLKISLPDGSVREVPAGSTPADVAAAIGPGLAKAALAARIDGELVDLSRPFTADATLALVTARDEADALDLARHDYAHVLAEAVQALFPGTQITFGPSTDDGFYYDFAPKDRAVYRRRSARDRGENARDHRRRQAAAPRSGGAATHLIAKWKRRAKASRPNGPPNCPPARNDRLSQRVRLATTCAAVRTCRPPASSIPPRSS